MVDTLTSAGDTITPRLILGYEAQSDSGNVTHRHLDSSVGVSLTDDSPRTGTLTLLFETDQEAWDAYALLRVRRVWELNVVEPVGVAMTFVREGSMAVRLDPESQRRWIVEVGFQEVSA